MNRPEAVFGSNVAVWVNRTGRTVTIKPKQYKDPETGQWKNAAGYNVSDIAHLAHCLMMALTHCIEKRNEETKAAETNEGGGGDGGGGGGGGGGELPF